MKLRSTLKFLANVVLGLVVSFALLEALFQAAGLGIQAAQALRNPVKNPNQRELRILALGESTTAEFFADNRDASWPGQLETMLNASGEIGMPVKVINGGVGGASTSYLLSQLDERLDQVEPHLVISMMGINDDVPLQLASSGDWARSSILSRLKSVRVFRWALRAVQAIWSRKAVSMAGAAPMSRFQGRLTKDLSPSDAQKLFTEVTTADERMELVDFFLLKCIHYDFQKDTKGDLRKAFCNLSLREALKVLASSPAHVGALRDCFLAADGADVAPNIQMIVLSAIDHGLAMDPQILTRLSYLKFTDPQAQEKLDGYLMSHDYLINKNDRAFQITMANYHRLYDKVAERKIFYFAMQYPTLSPAVLTNLFAETPDTHFWSYAEAAREGSPNRELGPAFAGVTVISNANFNDLVARDGFETYFTDQFAKGHGLKFGHTTAAGHREIARNAYAAIISRWPEIRATIH